MPDSVVAPGFYVLWMGLVFLPGILRFSVRRRMRKLDHPMVLHPRVWAPWMIGTWAVSLGSIFWLKAVEDVTAYPWGFAAVLAGGAFLGYLGQFLVESFTQRILVVGTTPAAVEDAIRDALHFLKLEIRRKGNRWYIEEPSCSVEIQKGSQPGTVDVQLHGSQGMHLVADIHELLQEDLVEMEPDPVIQHPIPFPILAMGIMAALAIGIWLSQQVSS